MTKTIDIVAKEWFNRTNGNSYWSARVTINYAMPDEFSFLMPFQYGYNDSSRDHSLLECKRRSLIPTASNRELRDDHGIIVRHNLHINRTKKDVLNWGEYE